MIERFEAFSQMVSEISKHWHKITSEEMGKYGLKGPHSLYLLAMERYKEGITAPKLSEVCGKDKADVSRMMSIMEEKGLVKKEGGNQNLYRGLLKLTDEGKHVADYVHKRVKVAMELAEKGLDEANRKVFYDALGLISGNLRKISKEGLPEDV